VLCGLAASGALAGLFVLIAWRSAGGWLQEADRATADWTLSVYSGPLVFLLSLISWLGSWQLVAVVAVVAGVLLCWWGRWRWAVALGAAAGGAGGLDQWLKQLLGRPRPLAALEAAPDYSIYSFPSGHVMLAVGLYGMCAWLVLNSRRGRGAKAWGVCGAAVVVLLVGVSRVYLRAHWLSDVLGGYAAGGAWLTLCVTVLVTSRR